MGTPRVHSIHLDMGARLDKEKFLLQHDEPNLFHRSEWDKAGTPSVWYSVYRVVLALFMVIGVWYTVFSAIYWAAGGTGACIHRCFDLPLNSTISKLDPSCPIHCDNYIYPILDWDAHPGMAIGIVLGGCVFMPVLQAFWYGVFKLRKYIAAKTL